MAQFQAINSEAEVNGQTVLSIANGLGSMEATGRRILAEHGLPDPQPDQWYSQQAWLDAFRHISDKVGRNTLYKIGTSIPDNAEFPPEIDDIFKALSAIDVAYHMNHRLKGKVLFDPNTGEMGEGIGHYFYQQLGPQELEVRCDNPYPCDFDRGIVEQMAKRFKPEGAIIRLTHDEAKGCRKNGDAECAYIVTW